MRYFEILTERGEPYLYHATPNPADAASIIYQNILLPRTEHRADELGLPSINGETYIKGVSLTRDGTFAHNWRSSGNEFPSIVFVLDWLKLKNHYRIRPYDYYQQRKKMINRDTKARSEAEEFCITNRGITPLDKYLVEIRMAKSLYEECIKEDEENYGDSNHPDSFYGPLTHSPFLKLI